MALSNDLISQFVKITNDKAEKKKESTVYGTTVIQDDTIYVRLDGSELLTPVTTASNTKNGERVIVMIKDHTAVITGNVSSPSARIEDIEDQSNAITEIEILVADKVDTSELNAVNARIDTLVSEDVLIKGQLTAAEADIDNLQANTLNINDKLTATEATIKELETDKLDASIAEITYATITDLDATNTTVHNLEATYGNFASLTTERFNALDATIDDLDATYATITDLNAERARIDILEAGVYREPKILWSGEYYMTAGHSITLSEAISKQNNGIVLVFSAFTDNVVGNYWWNQFFVPKYVVSNHSGTGHCFTLAAGNFSLVCMKYLLIKDTVITGHDNNNLTGTAASGITYTNNRFVLRYVIGV